MNPYFSVIIPTFNREKSLLIALDSLLMQSEQDLEAIIIDDGSTDNTKANLLLYVKKDTRIRYHQQENKGAAGAKNKGIEMATGKFITFLDSDDIYDSTHLKSRKEILVNDTSIKFLYGGVKIIGNKYVPNRFDTTTSIHIDDCAVGGTFLIERELLCSLGGFNDILLGEDSDLFDRINLLNLHMLEVK